MDYCCPFCGRADASATYTDRYGPPEWFIGCWSRSCKGTHLPSLADALGLGPGAGKEAIVAELRSRGHQPRQQAEPKPLPSLGKVMGWHSQLMASPEPLGYLTDVRGLASEVVASARVGWNGERLILPMYDHRGRLVAYKTRALDGQMRKPRGSGVWSWPLYPAVERGRGWTLLVAGEFDALRGLSAGLPAVSVTGGANHWRPEWTKALRKRRCRVVVAFDNGEQQQARERVAALIAAGINAQPLCLRELGLETAKGDLSDYLNSGGSAQEIRDLLNARGRRRKGGRRR